MCSGFIPKNSIKEMDSRSAGHEMRRFGVGLGDCGRQETRWARVDIDQGDEVY